MWPQIRNVHGFRYMDHEVDGNRIIPKPGFIAHRAGSRVDFLLDTTAPGGWEDHQAYVSFEFLRSYMHMGKARLICISGCTCTPYLLHGHWQERRSVTVTERFGVSQHKKCTVRLQVLSTSQSNEFKFKITSMSVGVERTTMLQ